VSGKSLDSADAAEWIRAGGRVNSAAPHAASFRKARRVIRKFPVSIGHTNSSTVADKHPASICVANYKGGVGKTTLVCLLGYYITEITGKRVLLFDIDPQCSLSLSVGFDPDEVSKTELTIYNLVKPSKWTKLKILKSRIMFSEFQIL